MLIFRYLFFIFIFNHLRYEFLVFYSNKKAHSGSSFLLLPHSYFVCKCTILYLDVIFLVSFYFSQHAYTFYSLIQNRLTKSNSWKHLSMSLHLRQLLEQWLLLQRILPPQNQLISLKFRGEHSLKTLCFRLVCWRFALLFSTSLSGSMIFLS